jgi:hypothetical protein
MRIAVAGTRSRSATREEAEAFHRLWKYLGGTVVLHGCCPAHGPLTDDVPPRMRGIDAWIDDRAKARGIPVEPYPPKQKSIGWPGCGPERNRRMVAAADAVVCFPGGSGTDSTRRLAIEMGKPLYEIFKNEWIGPCPLCGEPGGGYSCDCCYREENPATTGDPMNGTITHKPAELGTIIDPDGIHDGIANQ